MRRYGALAAVDDRRWWSLVWIWSVLLRRDDLQIWFVIFSSMWSSDLVCDFLLRRDLRIWSIIFGFDLFFASTWYFQFWSMVFYLRWQSLDLIIFYLRWWSLDLITFYLTRWYSDLICGFWLEKMIFGSNLFSIDMMIFEITLRLKLYLAQACFWINVWFWLACQI